MIALCTGEASIEWDGERFILSVPSGKDTLQIGMTRHQARMMIEQGRIYLNDMDREQAFRCAEIIAFKKPRCKAGRS